MNLPAIVDTSEKTGAPSRGDGPPLTAFGCVLVLLIAADRLLFDFRLGISAGLFLLLVAMVMPVANNWSGSSTSRRLVGIPVLLAALLPLVEAVNALTMVIGLGGFGLFAVVAGGGSGSLWQRSEQSLLLLVCGPVRLSRALAAALRLAGKQRPTTPGLTHWLLPVGIGLVFVALLQSANPIIERWIQQADIYLLGLLRSVSFWRVAFWFAIAAFCWPFLQLRLSSGRLSSPGRFRSFLGLTEATGHPDAVSTAPENGQAELLSHIVAPAAVTRSLVLFNVVFAVQSALDLVYLWGGATLPDGMTYASYAHRGAYPLVATALLAGGFVLLALRPGGGMEHRSLTRRLILLFAAQNVLLVVSSILRLDLYVAEYSLTQLRLAALVWMGLVAFGLALIFVRVVLQRSNRWLIDWNLRTLLVTLYACSLVNTTNLIASYNVDHSYELTGKGTRLDTGYLLRLGPSAIPALDRFVAEQTRAGHVDPALKQQIQILATDFDISMDHWQSWTLRRARLMQYLKDNGHVWP